MTSQRKDANCLHVNNSTTRVRFSRWASVLVYCDLWSGQWGSNSHPPFPKRHAVWISARIQCKMICQRVELLSVFNRRLGNHFTFPASALREPHGQPPNPSSCLHVQPSHRGYHGSARAFKHQGWFEILFNVSGLTEALNCRHHLNLLSKHCVLDAYQGQEGMQKRKTLLHCSY